MEVHDPRIRFSHDGHDFACTQVVLAQIAGGIEGDWTDICVTVDADLDVALAQVSTKFNQRERLDPQANHPLFRFRCLDAAFWVIDSADPNLAAKLAAHGFATEPYDVFPGGG